jgi:hypothetical protein
MPSSKTTETYALKLLAEGDVTQVSEPHAGYCSQQKVTEGWQRSYSNARNPSETWLETLAERPLRNSCPGKWEPVSGCVYYPGTFGGIQVMLLGFANFAHGRITYMDIKTYYGPTKRTRSRCNAKFVIILCSCPGTEKGPRITLTITVVISEPG